jgi:ATP-dependent DNA helicase RecG
LGRKPIKSRIVNPENFGQFLQFLGLHLSMGEQLYVVVPAIEESEKQNLAHLEEVSDKFCTVFPQYKIECLHGQMKTDQKSDVFRRFRDNKIQILIATTVIEVGINVPNATVMVIYNPERFGLSSLHQLRGRVGRGGKASFCFLINDGKISEESMKRIKVIEDTNDGFTIAEQDLLLRGEGDIFGVAQSGEAEARLANIVLHSAQLNAAQEDARVMIERKNPLVLNMIEKMARDLKVVSTV